MQISLEPFSPEVREPIIDILNFYIESSFAAYPENRVPYGFFDMLMKLSLGYATVVAKDDNRNTLGFGMLRAHNPIPTFAQAAEISYFIKPEHTGQGIGRLMLDYLVSEGRKRGLTSILASISSLNEGSIRFHLQNGFVECGRFQHIGKKHGEIFDEVWMQKRI